MVAGLNIYLLYIYQPEFTSASQCIYPPEIKYFIENFEDYYQNHTNSSRNIVWVNSEGSAEIAIQLGSKKYLATVTTHTLFALLTLENYN